jgi:hypothetical protein
LFVGDFAVELEVVEGEAVLAQSVVLKAERILRPFEKYSLGGGGLGDVFALG